MKKQPKQRATLVLACAAGLFAAAGCGGGGGIRPNVPPVIQGVSGHRVVDEGGTFALQPLVSNPDSDALSWTAAGLPDSATFSAATGALTWRTRTGDAGSYPVTLTVTDAAGGSDSTTVTLTVLQPGTSGPPPDGPTPLDGRAPVGVLDPFIILTDADGSAFLRDLGPQYTRWGAASSGALMWNQVLFYPDTFTVTTDALAEALPTGVEPIINITSKKTDETCGGFDTSKPHLPCDTLAWRGYIRAALNHIVPSVGLPLKDVVKVYQINNEPQTRDFWSGSKWAFARTHLLAAREIRSVCPDCTILLAGMTTPWLDSVLTYLDQMTDGPGSGASWFDAADVHLFGNAHGSSTSSSFSGYDYLTDYLAQYRALLDAHGAQSRPAWITETSAYGEEPSVTPDGNTGYPQDEVDQATDLVKRIVFPMANGVPVIVWTELIDADYFAQPTGYFSYTGLLTEASGKKLSFWTYQRLASSLGHLAWSRLTSVTPAYRASSQVRTFVVPDSLGRRNYVAWWDWYRDASPGPTAHVILQMSDGTDSVQVTELVPPVAKGTQVNAIEPFRTSVVPASAGNQVEVDLPRVPVLIEALPLAPARAAPFAARR